MSGKFAIDSQYMSTLTNDRGFTHIKQVTISKSGSTTMYIDLDDNETVYKVCIRNNSTTENNLTANILISLIRDAKILKTLKLPVPDVTKASYTDIEKYETDPNSIEIDITNNNVDLLVEFYCVTK